MSVGQGGKTGDLQIEMPPFCGWQGVVLEQRYQVIHYGLLSDREATAREPCSCTWPGPLLWLLPSLSGKSGWAPTQGTAAGPMRSCHRPSIGSYFRHRKSTDREVQWTCLWHSYLNFRFKSLIFFSNNKRIHDAQIAFILQQVLKPLYKYCSTIFRKTLITLGS